MAHYLGALQIGECQRCSAKYPRISLTEDGYIRNLLVCPFCYDEDHPQRYAPLERPEGMPPLRPAPPNEEFTPPVLTGVGVDGSGLDDAHIDTSWTEADAGPYLLDRYELWRAADAGSYAMLEEFQIEYDEFRAITSPDIRAYVDTAVTIGVVYSYYVLAYDNVGRQVRSNIVNVTFVDNQYQATPPVLSLSTETGPSATAHLTWTESTITLGSIDEYELFRSVDGGAFASFAFTDPDILAYDDDTIEGGSTYQYYVVAHPVGGLSSLDSNIVDTGLILTGVVVTDLRFDVANLAIDSAFPGLAYTIGPQDPFPSSDQPQYDAGRAFFDGAWGLGSQKSQLRSDSTALINLLDDWTLRVSAQPSLNVDLGGVPISCMVAIGSITELAHLINLEQVGSHGPFGLSINGVSAIDSGVNGIIGNSYAIVVTRTGNTIRMYVDGVLKGSTTTNPPADVNMRVTVGYINANESGLNNARWRGWLDNVYFLQGQALPP